MQSVLNHDFSDDKTTPTLAAFSMDLWLHAVKWIANVIDLAETAILQVSWPKGISDRPETKDAQSKHF